MSKTVFPALHSGVRIPQQTDSTIISPEPAASPQAGVADTDNDGLRDWEELLWKTDPNNSDTDFDGTSDGEELALGRDPLTAGPDDLLVALPELPVLPENEEGSPAARVARLFAKEYLKLAAPYAQITEEQQDELTNQAVIQAAKNVLQDKYTAQALLAGDNTPEAQIAYLNQAGAILNSSFRNVQEGELPLFGRYTETKDEKLLMTLQERVRVYATAEDALAKIAVPKAFQKTHLLLLNIFRNTGIAIDALRRAPQDNISAQVGIQWYIKETERSRALLDNIAGIIAQNHLSIKPEEDAYIFLSYAAKIQ